MLLKYQPTLDSKNRRSILIFFKDMPGARASLWHMGKQFVHVAIVLFDSNNAKNVSILGPDVNGIQINAECDWLKMARCLKWMRLAGAVEIYAIESSVERQKIGGIGWYWCHTLARDLARLPLGFVFNPRHLRRKILRYKGDEFKVVRRYVLWAESKTIQQRIKRKETWIGNMLRHSAKKLVCVMKRLVNRLRL